MFTEYGDFYAYKDTSNTCFLEFFYIDPNFVPDQKLETFIQLVKTIDHLRIVAGTIHKDAPRFIAHDRFDYK
jgi:hypothetical protein